jgi:hypothetical protein
MTMTISTLPQDLQQRLRAELRPGEMVIWSGQPDPGRFMKSGFKLWFFFVPWTAFAIFWIGGASGFHMPTFDSGWSFFPLFGLPFLLIGLGGMSSPFWLRRRAGSMVYAITNERVIAIEGSRTIIVTSYSAAEITDVERTEHRDGTGDLVLRRERYKDSEGDMATRKHGLFSIPEVRRVAGLVDKLVRKT